MISRVRESVCVGSYLGRFRENFAISRNAYLYLEIEKGHDEWAQVGHGRVTSPEWCAKPMGFFYVCREKHVHEGVVFHDGVHDVDFSGKDAVVHAHRWCKRPECPRCFLDGWAGDNARAIWGKMSAAIRVGYGEVLHFTVSFPEKDYDELVVVMGPARAEAVLRKRAEDGCFRRGFQGAALICHVRRIRKVDGRSVSLKFGLHYHGLGFLRGDYSVCRNCEVFLSRRCGVGCGECKGYEARTRREKVKDGLIVKIFGKRSSGLSEEESVIKTARYILSHASYIPSFRKRFYIVSYFGVCANRRLKSCKVPAVHACPVCATKGVKSVMVRCSHWGDEEIVRDIGDPRYRKCFPSDEFDGSGLPKFVDFGGGGSDG